MRQPPSLTRQPCSCEDHLRAIHPNQTMDTKDMRGTGIRFEHHEISTPAPSESFTRNQIFDLERIGSGDLKTFNRDIGKSALRIERIEVNHDQEDIVQGLRRLGIE